MSDDQQPSGSQKAPGTSAEAASSSGFQSGAAVTAPARLRAGVSEPAPGRDGAPDDGSRPNLIGQLLAGKYELRRVIGEGGRGCVYLAHQSGMDRYVAVKTLGLSVASEESLVDQFFTEVKAASRLNHPNTVRIYDFGAFDDVLFMVLEVLKGRSLAQLMAAEGPLPARRALTIALQICDSLAEAHQHGVTHLDLTPDNVHIERMFGNPDHVKVLDFGLAKLAPWVHPTSPRGQVMWGTPAYMSPEQIDGRAPLDGRADIYGLGILLFEMLAGHPPFRAGAPSEVLEMQLGDEPPALSESAEGSPQLVDLIARMLSKAPSKRPSGCTALRQELDALARSLDPLAPSTDTVAEPTMRFGSGDLSRGLEGPRPEQRLGRERWQPQTATYETHRRPDGTAAALNRKTPVPDVVSPDATWTPDSNEVLRSGTPPTIERTRRLNTGQMQVPPAALVRGPPTDPPAPANRPEVLSPALASPDRAVGEVAPGPRTRTPGSRRIDARTLMHHGDVSALPKAKQPESSPMKPTRVALLHAESGDTFDLIASNEIRGVLQCLSAAAPAAGTPLTLLGAESRFAHVQAVVDVGGKALDVPADGFIDIRWKSLSVSQKTGHMKTALAALLSIDAEAVTGWPREPLLETGMRLSYVPRSGRLTLERSSTPEVSLAERSRGPSWSR